MAAAGHVGRDQDMFLGTTRALEELALRGVGDAVVAADRSQLGVVGTAKLTGAVVVPALGTEVADLMATSLRLDAERKEDWKRQKKKKSWAMCRKCQKWGRLSNVPIKTNKLALL